MPGSLRTSGCPGAGTAWLQARGLGKIAGRYKTTVATIAKVNELEVKAPLPVNVKLVIPVTSRQAARAGTVRLRYRIRWGDTLSELAKRFGVSISNLRRWNRIRGSRLVAGRFLVILPQAAGHRSHGLQAAFLQQGGRKGGSHFRR